MQRGSLQGYAASLERTMETMRLDLGEAMVQFQELCPLITPERHVPGEIITDIHQTYKRIQDQITKIGESNNSWKENTGSIITGTLSVKERSWNLYFWPRVCIRNSKACYRR